VIPPPGTGPPSGTGASANAANAASAANGGAPVGPLRAVAATRYVMPFRQGGSMPGLVEADDDGLYVLKFRGAGQGVRALIAELVAGEVARALAPLGLLVPEIVYVELDPALGRSEPDYEIRKLIEASEGTNAGLDFLPGALNFDPLVTPPPEDLAAAIVWLDAYVTNVDRTPRNVNLLTWHRRLWLIDHGASLYFHHGGGPYTEAARSPFPQIADHVLLPFATPDALRRADAACAELLTPDVIHRIVSLVPDSWLDDPAFATADAHRAAYATYLLDRLAPPRPFLDATLAARARPNGESA
jgi:hypothetical protein